jgi:ubiquinone/menaquinone biosynthesis C-methylase UbiE
MSKKNKTSKPEPLPLRLNFGCGQIKVEGFVGVDLFAKEADIKADLTKFPLPWKDNSVDSIMASHFVEHIEAQKRWPFFDECWRILKPGGLMQIVVPNFKSERAYGDNTHCWPPFTTFSFYYLNRGWREANKLTHGPYALKCDFDFMTGTNGISEEFRNRSQDAQSYALRHYWETYQDMFANLTKKA